MTTRDKLLHMLSGYAAAHQHPFNILVHMVGIPLILFGLLIPLTWIGIDIGTWSLHLAHLLVIGLALFYLTLERLFALVFLLAALLLAEAARVVGMQPRAEALLIAALAFGGGYALQFLGHAVEKSMPVLVRHPIQANLAAPFFTVVEAFKLLGLRDELFKAVQAEIELKETAPASRPAPASRQGPGSTPP